MNPHLDTVHTTSRCTWFDLPAVKLHDAMSFYEGLLGWKYRQMDPSPLGRYVMVEVNGILIGGIRQVTSPVPHSHPSVPILYFTVPELAPKVARAKELGASLVGDRVELGQDRGCYQWIRDREGNLIGLWAPQ